MMEQLPLAVDCWTCVVVVQDAGLSSDVVLHLVDKPPDGQKSKCTEEDDGKIAGLSDAILRACQYTGGLGHLGMCRPQCLNCSSV